MRVLFTLGLAVVILLLGLGLLPQLFAVSQDQDFARVAGLHWSDELTVTTARGIVLSWAVPEIGQDWALFGTPRLRVGAQLGARLAQRVKPDYLRFLLAALVLIVAIRLAIGLGWRPDEIYTVQLS